MNINLQYIRFKMSNKGNTKGKLFSDIITFCLPPIAFCCHKFSPLNTKRKRFFSTFLHLKWSHIMKLSNMFSLENQIQFLMITEIAYLL